MRSGAKFHVAVQRAFLCISIATRERKKMRNTAYIEFGAGGIFFLGVKSRGENFNGDSCPKPERIHEYFALVYIRQLGVAIVKLF